MAKARSPEVDVVRLCRAMHASRRALEVFRQERMQAVRRYAGSHYSSETAQTLRPINFLSLYVSIISRNLISHDPRVLLDTNDRKNRAAISALESWANTEIVRMNLADTLLRAVVDALFSFGVVKVGLLTPGESEMQGWTQEFGQPFAKTIDLDDFVIDSHARTWEEAAWMGHRVRVPLASLTDSPLYPKAKAKSVQANRDRQWNETGDERISMIQRQYVGDDSVEAYDYVDVWEVYLCREKLVLTLLSDDGGVPLPSDFKGEKVPLSVRPWVGPYCGPYHCLGFLTVPGQAIPKGPIQDVLDMDEHLNGCFQKLIDQAARQKDLLAYGSASDSDVERVKNAADGEIVRVTSADQLKPLAFGGPFPGNQAFALQLWDFLNKVSGNLELMGGLGAQSKTATQDKLLNMNSSRSVVDMQQVTVKFTADVIKSLTWFWHHHPQKVMTGYQEIRGLPWKIPQVLTPARRASIPHDTIDFQVNPYTFQYQTPQDRLGFLNQVIGQVLAPMMPILMQQGVYFDVSRYVDLIAEYGNAPDLTDIFRVGDPPTAEGSGAEDVPTPQTGEKTYNRVNTSEATEPGQNKAVQQALLNQNPGGARGYQGAAA